MTGISDSQGGNIARGYDDLDRVTSETTAQGNVTYSYDAASRRTSFQISGQPTVSYGYDNADRVTSIAQTDARVTFGYDPAGRRSTMTLPSGIVATYAYDIASQLLQITYASGGQTVGSLLYSYDSVGNRTKTSGTLSSWNQPPSDSSATYDAANRLVTWNQKLQAYDGNGNLLDDGQVTYSWDSRNRLITLAGAVTARFTYDGFNRRTSKSINGSQIDYVYDGLNASQELSNGQATAEILHGLGIDETYRRTDSVGPRDFIVDAAGSTVALVDTAGSFKTTYSYEPYGHTTATGETSSNPSQYTGRENDGSDLYFLRNRYYKTDESRFISEDPIGWSSGQTNLYAYAYNPLQWVDPMGLQGTKTYQTYTKVNLETGVIYSGRTSGYGTPEQNVARRDLGHHLDECWGPAQLDRSSNNSDAIRGREQQNIDEFGGARSMGGRSGNAINGISPTNPKMGQYMGAAANEFGRGGGGGNLSTQMLPHGAEIPFE
ncbi:RHS repeat-associated protein [Paraburkholderia sp. GAS199]|uniref:RHS repeat-associated core domain-containing protein n=1 Tax=Paraburkholderia sp. GAS199 TaxID=3035126 RepID=UPI003D19B5D2